MSACEEEKAPAAGASQEVEAPPAWRDPANVAAATAAGLLWVLSKQAPAWPAQRLSGDGLATWRLRIPCSRIADDLALVQYFGTGEFGWVTGRELLSWSEGLAQNKDRPPRIRSALTQAAGLACNSRAWPVGWWSLPAGQIAAPVLPPSRKRKAREAGAGGAKEKQGSGPQYVKLRRNEWAPGLRAPKPRNLDLSSVCQCSRPAGAPPPGPGRAKVAAAQRSGCGSDCLNRSMNTFCDPRTCPCGDVCSNRPFQLLPPPKARPLQTQGRGWGLAAAQAVRKGAFVVEYMGEVLNDAMCEQRLWADKLRGETNFYLMEVHRNQVIDAHYKGNTSRLINSACRPNCETQRWVDGASGETRVGIFALRDIADGEEFTYDYCFTHFGDDDATSFHCVCGAPNCRGTLDANPQRGLNRGRRIEVQWDDGVYYAATIAAFNANTGKYRLVYDDGDAETVRLEADPAKRRPDDVTFRWLPDQTAPQPAQDMASMQHVARAGEAVKGEELPAALPGDVALAAAPAEATPATALPLDMPLPPPAF